MDNILNAFIKFYLLKPMDQYKDILDNIQDIQTSERLMAQYKDNFDTITKEVEPDIIYKTLEEHPDHLVVLSALYVGALFTKRDFESIYDFLRELNLSGSARHMDYYNSKLLKYYYLSMKYLGKNIDILYNLHATNKEYGNTHSVAVLTNCMLDFQINNGIYHRITAEITDSAENARYSFYHGIICLVRGEYRHALSYFNTADILHQEPSLELKIKKYTIVCKLLLGDFSISYSYRDDLKPYFSLIGAVRRAETGLFYEIMEEYKAELFSLNLWFIARRLLNNLLREGLRKISVCYSRISVSDISQILGVNVDFLLHSCIRSGFISGHVENATFHGNSENRLSHASVGDHIVEVISVQKAIMGMMKYPEIVPLTYESYRENAIKDE